MLPNMIQIIKKAAVEAVEASKPVKICFGEITKKSPLTVKIEQRLELSDDFLVITETAKKASLAKGDYVLLIRMQGGQSYVVIDKVGDIE